MLEKDDDVLDMIFYQSEFYFRWIKYVTSDFVALRARMK